MEVRRRILVISKVCDTIYNMNLQIDSILSQPTAHKTPLKKVLAGLQKGLRQLYGSQCPRVMLYGSFARGEAKPHSDIDILLIFPHKIQPGEELMRLGELLADLNLRYAVLVSVQPVTAHQYQTATGPFWRNIRREGMAIDGV
jgi:uncharacterized protein